MLPIGFERVESKLAVDATVPYVLSVSVCVDEREGFRTHSFSRHRTCRQVISQTRSASTECATGGRDYHGCGLAGASVLLRRRFRSAGIVERTFNTIQGYLGPRAMSLAVRRFEDEVGYTCAGACRLALCCHWPLAVSRQAFSAQAHPKVRVQCTDKNGLLLEPYDPHAALIGPAPDGTMLRPTKLLLESQRVFHEFFVAKVGRPGTAQSGQAVASQIPVA